MGNLLPILSNLSNVGQFCVFSTRGKQQYFNKVQLLPGSSDCTQHFKDAVKSGKMVQKHDPIWHRILENITDPAWFSYSTMCQKDTTQIDFCKRQIQHCNCRRAELYVLQSQPSNLQDLASFEQGSLPAAILRHIQLMEAHCALTAPSEYFIYPPLRPGNER